MWGGRLGLRDGDQNGDQWRVNLPLPKALRLVVWATQMPERLYEICEGRVEGPLSDVFQPQSRIARFDLTYQSPGKGGKA